MGALLALVPVAVVLLTALSLLAGEDIRNLRARQIEQFQIGATVQGVDPGIGDLAGISRIGTQPVNRPHLNPDDDSRAH